MSEAEAIEFDPTEMTEFIRYLQRSPFIMPRIYVCEFPFFIIIENLKRIFCLGVRPEDLADIDTINKRVWKRHSYYLYRLAQFPLDKAEYYQRLKEVHAVNTVRGLSKITGEDWSYIAKVLRMTVLPESIKEFLRNSKNNPRLIHFFSLRRLSTSFVKVMKSSSWGVSGSLWRNLKQGLSKLDIFPIDVIMSTKLICPLNSGH